MAESDNPFDDHLPPINLPYLPDDLQFHDYSNLSFLNDNDNDAVSDSDIQDLLRSLLSDQIPSIPDDSASKSVSFQIPDDPTGYFNQLSSDYGSKSPESAPNYSNSDPGRFLNISSSDSRDSSPAAFGVLNCTQIGDSCGPTSSSQCSDNQNSELQEPGKSYSLKRKKGQQDVNFESERSVKSQRSNLSSGVGQCNGNEPMCEEEDKRKARLIRNRESAQLSRERKKHYVEELEEKVRAMHSTIQDLNARISYVVAENVTLRQQMGGGGGALGHPPTPGMYMPMAPMVYPWMPYPPYAVQSQGSVPLVPIPRLKPQERSVKTNNKKREVKSKTKKAASVSFLGLLFFILLFGGLVPMLNVKYGGLRDTFSGRSSFNMDRFYNQDHYSKVYVVNGTSHDSTARDSSRNIHPWKNFNDTSICGRSQVGGVTCSEECSHAVNASEPLVASLYVPRNDKLVKIDGNLIIQSVLASEKAMASHNTGANSGGETSLAVPFNLPRTISIAGQSSGTHSQRYHGTAEQQRALASGSAGNSLKSNPADGKVQQWFREGLAGPMLSSGMCTEVLRFEVSPTPGAMIPAPLVRNISVEERQNSTHINKGKNRRILHPLPVPLAGAANNISEEKEGFDSQKENSKRNSSLSPIVVSVLVDPREVSDTDGVGMMGGKSLSRIFVVVLLDSVKYVTYSCVLPFKGSSHLVTT